MKVTAFMALNAMMNDENHWFHGGLFLDGLIVSGVRTLR
jgi:hypothetical protein